MKKYFFLIFVAFSFPIFADAPIYDFQQYLVRQYVWDSETPLPEFYSPCTSLDSVQSLYKEIDSHKFFYLHGEHRTFLSRLASSTPKTELQKQFYPYRNTKYADEGSGIWDLCTSGNQITHGGGVVKLKGHVQLTEANIEVSEEGNSRIADLQPAYFVVEEVKDPNFLNLPGLVQEGGTIKLPLGCFEPNLKTFDYLTQTIDQKKGIYSISDKTIGRRTSTLLYENMQTPNQEISIYVYLKPNAYLPMEENIPCFNPLIERVVVEEGSEKNSPNCLLNSKGVCDPDLKKISEKACKQQGGILYGGGYVSSEKNWNPYTQEEIDIYHFNGCGKDTYLGHVKNDRPCCIPKKK